MCNHGSFTYILCHVYQEPFVKKIIKNFFSVTDLMAIAQGMLKMWCLVIWLGQQFSAPPCICPLNMYNQIIGNSETMLM